MDRTSLCNKVDVVRLYASYRLNILLLIFLSEGAEVRELSIFLSEGAEGRELSIFLSEGAEVRVSYPSFSLRNQIIFDCGSF